MNTRKWRLVYANDSGGAFDSDVVYADCYEDARAQARHPMGPHGITRVFPVEEVRHEPDAPQTR